MSVPIVTFFNNKGGVGKTSLVYHTAWMLSELGRRTLVVDLDPQASLTTAFLGAEAAAFLWEQGDAPSTASTLFECIRPVLDAEDARQAEVLAFDRISLVPGDLRLAQCEDDLAARWSQGLDGGDLRIASRSLTAFWHLAQESAASHGAELILFDVSSSLGALNRAALLATDFVVIPLAGEVSIQALRMLGPTLRNWRSGWEKRRAAWGTQDPDLPPGTMTPVGYVVQQPEVHLRRALGTQVQWFERVPQAYRQSILDRPIDSPAITVLADWECLAVMKPFRSLAPMAQEARRPIFLLRPADGAVGAHAVAARSAYADFAALTKRLLGRIGLEQEQP